MTIALWTLRFYIDIGLVVFFLRLYFTYKRMNALDARTMYRLGRAVRDAWVVICFWPLYVTSLAWKGLLWAVGREE